VITPDDGLTTNNVAKPKQPILSSDDLNWKVSVSGKPTISRDKGGEYDARCQALLCLLIEFDSDKEIPATDFKVQLEALLNPESVHEAGKIKIATMLKYPCEDEGSTVHPITTHKCGGPRDRYYPIDDTGLTGVASKFRAKAGLVEKMSVPAQGALDGYTYRDR